MAQISKESIHLLCKSLFYIGIGIFLLCKFVAFLGVVMGNHFNNWSSCVYRFYPKKNFSIGNSLFLLYHSNVWTE